MGVTIKLNLPLKELIGQDSIIVEGKTVNECLADLIRRYPAARDQLYDREDDFILLILLNNKPLPWKDLNNPVIDPVPQQNLNYPVAEKDELWFLSIVTGG